MAFGRADKRSQTTFGLPQSLCWFWCKFIYKKECVDDYLQGLEFLKQGGYAIVAVVSDGLRGLSKAVSPLPFQFCQFHAQNYAKIKLTNNPKTEAGINLLKIAKSLSYCSSSEFKGLLDNFYNEFVDFLSENKGTAFCEAKMFLVSEAKQSKTREPLFAKQKCFL